MTAPASDVDQLEGLDFTPACDIDSCDRPAVAVRTHRPSQCPILLCIGHRHTSDRFLATRPAKASLVCLVCNAEDIRPADFHTTPLT